MIYLDNSSTTHHKPLRVVLKTLQALTKQNYNPSRGSYRNTIKTQEKVFECREKLANMLGTTPDSVIFTSGCTMAINLGLMGTAKKNGHIITTTFEHNSVIRVLERLKTTHNITYSVATPNKNGQITQSELSKYLQPNTYMVIVNHTSNVAGITQNVQSIGKFCKKNNLLFFVDGAQSVGHEYINMQEFNINMLSVAGHKGLYAPQGIGALLINDCMVEPLLYGGTGTHSDKAKQPTDYPDGLESGTPNLSGILGMSAGIDFVIKNQNKINNKINKLTSKLIEGLERIKHVETIHGEPTSGVVSIAIKGKDSSEVSSILDQEYNICSRSGLHCAFIAHKYFKTLKTGTTRFSISYFNKMSNIKKVIKAVEKIALS